MTGPTGTGKTLNVENSLSALDPTKFMSMSITFSAQTTVSSVQDNVDGKLCRKKFGVFGPEGQKKMIFFIDDFNMPKKEFYGAQPPIEIIRA